jgi:hypothetical protein
MPGQSRSTPGGNVGVGGLGGGDANGIATFAANKSSARSATTSTTTTAIKRSERKSWPFWHARVRASRSSPTSQAHSRGRTFWHGTCPF